MNSKMLERVLVAWFDVVQPARVPEGLLDEAFAITRRTPQRGRRLARLQLAVAELTRARSLSLSPSLATVLLLALLAAMMLAAAIIGGRLLNAPTTPGWHPLGGVEDAIDGSVYVADAAAATGRFVVVGSSLADGEDGCRVHRGHAWTSADGREWTLAETSFADASIETVLAGEEGFYALGFTDRRYERADGECHWRHGSRAMWRSEDGREWTLLPAVPTGEQDWWASLVEVDGAPVVVALHQDYVETGPGMLEPGGQETQVWRLADDSWQLLSTVSGAFIAEVAAADRRIVGIGFADMEQQQSVAWASADGGRTWVQAEALPRGTRLYDLAASDKGFVAVGAPGGEIGGEGVATAWSSDGLDWQIVQPDIPARGGLLGVWPTGSGFVAVSQQYAEIDPHRCPPGDEPPPALATPVLSADPAASGQPDDSSSPQAEETPAGSEAPPSCWTMRLEPRAWLSADGATWSVGPGVPSTDRTPVADPIPAPRFGGASASSGFVFTNPGYGARVWLVPPAEMWSGAP